MSAPHTRSTPSKIRAALLLVIIGIFGVYITVLGAVTAYNQVRDLIGTGGVPHILGSFFTNNGNPGSIFFAEKPTDGYSGAHLFVPEVGTQTLTGSFWVDTIGWISLQDITLNRLGTGTNIWSLSGYAWSESAGWIDFSETTYNLSNTSFSGYAWNDGIGWIDMLGASLDMTSSGAIGKVKVLGNLGGNRIYNTIYDLSGKISPVTTNKIVNEVRKNVALVTRNLPTDKVNTTLITNNVFDGGSSIRSIANKLVFENTGATVARVNYTSSIQSRLEDTNGPDEPIYSVIAIGADIYIDDSVALQGDGKPRAMIALKNEAGVGGNIYIRGGVTQIYSSLVAERSLYSGEFTGATANIYNNDANNLFRIPNRQLYIYGTIIANNTIGGYVLDNNTANSCPYDIVPCDNNTALTYDYNHFRDFQKDSEDSVYLRGYQPPGTSSPSDKYDNYSLIIEHDPRVISDPPPGLERMQ